MKKLKFTFIITCIFFCVTIFAQPNMQYSNLRNIAFKMKNVGPLNYQMPSPIGEEIDYLKCIFQSISMEDSLIKLYSKNSFYDNLSQNISFSGDYKTTLEVADLGFTSNAYLNDDEKKLLHDKLKTCTTINANNYILDCAKNYKVVMLNEAHCKPLHRAFVFSLLEDFYRIGFRYLAMETLSNYQFNNLKKLSQSTGYYTTEPIGGELVRHAINIGFKLVAYEDNIYPHTPTQRDSTQAENINKVFLQDSNAKILVLAGYGHIGLKERKLGSNQTYTPLGLAFKRLTDITPLTIDQTDMTEGGNSKFGNMYYEFVSNYLKNKQPVIVIQKDKVETFNSTDFDIVVVHPKTTYINKRAKWYSLGNERKSFLFTKENTDSFLIQAYYKNEILDSNFNTIIPADQTYLQTKKNQFCLFLRNGNYKIVFRDIYNNILLEKNLEVK